MNNRDLDPPFKQHAGQGCVIPGNDDECSKLPAVFGSHKCRHLGENKFDLPENLCGGVATFLECDSKGIHGLQFEVQPGLDPDTDLYWEQVDAHYDKMIVEENQLHSSDFTTGDGKLAFRSLWHPVNRTYIDKDQPHLNGKVKRFMKHIFDDDLSRGTADADGDGVKAELMLKEIIESRWLKRAENVAMNLTHWDCLQTNAPWYTRWLAFLPFASFCVWAGLLDNRYQRFQEARNSQSVAQLSELRYLCRKFTRELRLLHRCTTLVTAVDMVAAGYKPNPTR